jgi:tol-pal system protein YbgF
MARFVILVLLAIAVSAPAHAQSRREIAARLDAVEARMAEAEGRALQGDPVAETLMARLDAVEREQRILTGEIERLAFENRRMRQELEQLGRNVEALLAGAVGQSASGDGPALLEPGEIDPDDPFGEARADDVQPLQAPDGVRPLRQGSAPQPAALSGPADAQADPRDVYAAGRARLLDGDFAGAREAFERYTEQFPQGEQAGGAWYWLGETHFVNGAFDDAADAYIASLRTDRRGPQGPDALVRLGASLDGLGQTGRACEVLATFPQEFPNASVESRRKAQREISRIGCG